MAQLGKVHEKLRSGVEEQTRSINTVLCVHSVVRGHYTTGKYSSISYSIGSVSSLTIARVCRSL